MSQDTASPDNSTRHFMLTSLSSIIAGGFARLCCHPIDTIKAKIQVETSKLHAKDVGKGVMWKIAKDTVKKEGLRGLYQGIGITSIGSAPALAIFFTMYEVFKHTIEKNGYFKDSENLKNFCSGMGAEFVSCILWVPIDVVKERLQVQSNLQTYSYKNSLDAIKVISRTEGIKGLYKAYGATVMSFGPYNGLYLSTYEFFKKKFAPNREVKFYESFVFSMFASGIAGIITNPLDMSKLRMQVQRAETAMSGTYTARFGYKNMFHGVYMIYKNEGFLSMYKGSIARIAYHVPASAMTMSVLEYVRYALHKAFGEKDK